MIDYSEFNTVWSAILVAVAAAAIAACTASGTTSPSMEQGMTHVPLPPGYQGLQKPNGTLDNRLMPAQAPNG